MSAPDHVVQARQRGQRRRERRDHGREPGAFRVRSDPDPDYKVSIEISYTEQASADAIRTQLTESYGVAITEIARRFGQ